MSKMPHPTDSSVTDDGPRWGRGSHLREEGRPASVRAAEPTEVGPGMRMLQVLAPDGSVVGDLPDLTDEQLVDLHRLMLRSRAFDRRALAAQRQGRLGTYAMLEGHEAAQVGSAAALRPGDFVYPAYREHGVQFTRGSPSR